MSSAGSIKNFCSALAWAGCAAFRESGPGGGLHEAQPKGCYSRPAHQSHTDMQGCEASVASETDACAVGIRHQVPIQ